MKINTIYKCNNIVKLCIIILTIFINYNITYAENIGYTKGSVVDIDGNKYITFKIGRQEWMAENLKVSRYNNGDPIKNITDYDEWNFTTSGAWAFYENNKNYNDYYGKLYNWYSIKDPRGLAPKGWHVPSKNEWEEFVKYLGGYQVAGTMIKTLVRLSHIRYGEVENWDPLSFYAGSRYLSGAFCFRMYNTYFWTSSGKDNNQSWYLNINNYNSEIYNDYNFNKVGMSILCVKDY